MRYSQISLFFHMPLYTQIPIEERISALYNERKETYDFSSPHEPENIDPFRIACSEMVSLVHEMKQLQERQHQHGLIGTEKTSLYQDKNRVMMELLKLIQKHPGLIRQHDIRLKLRKNDRYNRMIALVIPGLVKCYIPHQSDSFVGEFGCTGEEYLGSMLKYMPKQADEIRKNMRRKMKRALAEY